MYKRKQNPLILLGGIIIMLSIIFTMCSQKKQDKLKVYEGDIVSTQEITTESLNIDTFTYENLEAGFQMEIPAEWNKVVKDGYDTYIHIPSSSSIQIQIEPYNPSINMTTQESLSSEITQNGYTFVSSNQIDTSSYEVMYQKITDSTYDYIEETRWNRKYIVKLLCIFNDENYKRIYPYYEKIINSFNWTTEDIIPSDIFLYYSQYGDFEFAVPLGWSIGSSDSSYVAVNSNNTAQITITVSEHTDLLSEITATDMTNYLNTNKNAFMLKDFSTSATEATATASYNNGTASTNRTYLIANGQYLYSIQFDYYDNSIDETLPAICRSYFREFITQKIIDDSQAATPSDAP